MTDDPMLSRVRRELKALYGDNLDRIVLFGSRARGDARGDSDYDIAVFLKTIADRSSERRRLGELRFAMMEETGQFLDIQAFSAESYEERIPLMWEIRSDGKHL